MNLHPYDYRRAFKATKAPTKFQLVVKAEGWELSRIKSEPGYIFHLVSEDRDGKTYTPNIFVPSVCTTKLKSQLISIFNCTPADLSRAIQRHPEALAAAHRRMVGRVVKVVQHNGFDRVHVNTPSSTLLEYWADKGCPEFPVHTKSDTNINSLINWAKETYNER